jgi:hypothetical protein
LFYRYSKKVEILHLLDIERRWVDFSENDS